MSTGLLFHGNILILFTYFIEKLEIPNSTRKRVNKKPGCAAVIFRRVKTLGPTLPLVNGVAESSEQSTGSLTPGSGCDTESEGRPPFARLKMKKGGK